MKPTDREYWDRPADVVAKELPGERLLTGEHMLIVTKVESFKELLRGGMLADFEQEDRKPGDVYVTHARGHPLLNVTTTVKDGTPQVVWIREMMEQGEVVKGTGIVAYVASEMRKKIAGKGKPLSFAMAHLDGKSVLEPKSPLHIIENVELPLDTRGISFNKTGGTAKNSTGVASLTDDVNGIKTIEQATAILRVEADRLGIPLGNLMEPNNYKKYMKTRPLLRTVIKFFTGEA